MFYIMLIIPVFPIEIAQIVKIPLHEIRLGKFIDLTAEVHRVENEDV